MMKLSKNATSIYIVTIVLDWTITQVQIGTTVWRKLKRNDGGRWMYAESGLIVARIVMNEFYNLICIMNIYLDIETVANLTALSEDNHILRDKYLKKMEKNPDWWAALWPEFGKIVCISVSTDSDLFPGDTWVGDDEGLILHKFAEYVKQFKDVVRVWHNIKKFDIPYLTRRMIVNWLQLPPALKMRWKKPREMNVEDTMEMWACNTMDKVSLETICLLLKVPNPKENTDGSSVENLYALWKLDAIATYCAGDVKATKQVYKVMKFIL